jgi:hypothetical protein
MSAKERKALRADIDRDAPMVRVYLSRREMLVLAQHYASSVENLEILLRQREATPLAKHATASLKRRKRRMAELRLD